MGEGRYGRPFKGSIGIEDAVYSCGHHGDAAKFEDSTEILQRHVASNLTGGTVIARAMKLGTLPTQPPPSSPTRTIVVKDEAGTPITVPNDELETEMIMYKHEFNAFMRRVKSTGVGNNELFYLLQGQCAPDLMTKIKATKGWKSTDAAQDGIALLGIIKQFMGGVEQHIQPTMAFAMSYKKLYCHGQKGKHFKSSVAGIEDAVPSCGRHGDAAKFKASAVILQHHVASTEILQHHVASNVTGGKHLKSSVAGIEDAVLSCGRHGDAAKFKGSKRGTLPSSRTDPFSWAARSTTWIPRDTTTWLWLMGPISPPVFACTA